MCYSWNNTHLVQFLSLLWFWKDSDNYFQIFHSPCNTVVFDEHFKDADTETSSSHVLILFISPIREKNSGSFAVM